MLTNYDNRIRELQDEFHSLSIDEQLSIMDDFNDACIDSGREPSEYWYPLLMPRAMKGYVGD